MIWFRPDGSERGQGEEVIAWAEYGTPRELPSIHHRKEYDATASVEPDHRITCVFVDKRYRRRGITEVAITGALDLIAEARATGSW